MRVPDDGVLGAELGALTTPTTHEHDARANGKCNVNSKLKRTPRRT